MLKKTLSICSFILLILLAVVNVYAGKKCEYVSDDLCIYNFSGCCGSDLRCIFFHYDVYPIFRQTGKYPSDNGKFVRFRQIPQRNISPGNSKASNLCFSNRTYGGCSSRIIISVAFYRDLS